MPGPDEPSCQVVSTSNSDMWVKKHSDDFSSQSVRWPHTFPVFPASPRNTHRRDKSGPLCTDFPIHTHGEQKRKLVALHNYKLFCYKSTDVKKILFYLTTLVTMYGFILFSLCYFTSNVTHRAEKCNTCDSRLWTLIQINIRIHHNKNIRIYPQIVFVKKLDSLRSLYFLSPSLIHVKE